MSTPYIGQIRILAFAFAPSGHALCQGQLMPISNNAALFTVLGTSYGGDGSSTFALPDFRGRTPVHQGVAVSGSVYVIGAAGGEENVQLSLSQLPPHGHALVASALAASSATPGSALLPGALNGDTFYAPVSGATAVPLAGAAVQPTGDTLPHPNMMPSLAMNASISLLGVYPSRN